MKAVEEEKMDKNKSKKPTNQRCFMAPINVQIASIDNFVSIYFDKTLVAHRKCAD